MCGIAGFWGKTRNWEKEIKSMCDRIAHRGPDAMGVWGEENTEIVLGHRRLSIFDLSESGRQPMISQDGRYVISYNGEVYNYKDIAKKMQYENEGKKFISRTDTEVLLEAICEWGLMRTLQSVRGMFAFALYDRKMDVLYLVRDRVGEKPLYYGCSDGKFVFASELAAIERMEHFDNKIDPEALQLYFQHGYIPAPYSVYKRIHKLEAGTILTVRNKGKNVSEEIYWSVEQIAINGQRNLFQGDEEDAAKNLECLLKESIGMQMLADVPVGAFLSAGIDSSTIVALMQDISEVPVRTFTIGVDSDQLNEAVIARQIATRLGTHHTELYISPKEAQELIPRLGYFYSEPFADSSQIPTMLVSKLAKEQVTVCLSGDGGDELFAGYNFYSIIQKTWGQIMQFPLLLRKPVGWISRNLPVFNRTKLAQTGGVLSCKSPEDLYNWYRIREYNEKLLKSNLKVCSKNDLYKEWTFKECQQNIMLMDMEMYHPDDILAKVDRAAMSYSLETRIPMLDVKVVEFAWSLPFEYKKKDGITKRVLRDILYQYVPKELMERPKTGFSIPIYDWLHGEMKLWAEGLLHEVCLEYKGLFNEKNVQSLWTGFQKNSSGGEQVWRLLMFGEWSRNRGKRWENVG